MMKIIPFLLIVFLLYVFVEPKIVWENTFRIDANADSYLTDVINLPNGHLAVLGHSKEGKSQIPFFLLVDGLSGKEISKMKIPTEGEPKLNSLSVTEDGYILLVGSSIVKNKTLGWLVKMTLEGDWVEAKTIPADQGQYQFEKIVSLSSGENILLARCDKVLDGSRWLGRVTGDLNTEQLNMIGRESIAEIVDMKAQRGNKILIAANSKKSKISNSDHALLFNITNPKLPITYETPFIEKGNVTLLK